MPSLTSATVVTPDDFIDLLDANRVADLLINDGETAISQASINTNTRALFLCRVAWGEIKKACTRGKVYSHQELVDLANDEERGAAFLALIADIFWVHLIKRRRYVSGEPQAKPQEKEDYELALQQLREGERIWDLEGVTIHNAAGAEVGTYENTKGEHTHLHVGTLGQTNCNTRDNRFWGCTDPCPPSSSSRYTNGGCCGC